MKIFKYVKKVKYKVVFFVKVIYWKLEYGKQLIGIKNISFRKDMIINISDSGKIKIGKNTFFNNFCSLNAHGEITIGDDCLFGENVKIYDHNHIFYSTEKTNTQSYDVGKVNIGNNFWICSNVVILKGARIGSNCTISAGCIIKESVPDNSLVRLDSQRQITENIRIKNVGEAIKYE